MGNQLPLVFLCGHRKGGTSLFSSLLDSHKELLVYPTDLTLMYGYFPQYVKDTVSDTARIERLRTVLKRSLEARGAVVAGDLSGLFDKLYRDFFDQLDARRTTDIGYLIRTLISAYHSAIQAPSPASMYTVLKETSLELYAAEIGALFPAAKFIQLVRDPRDNFAALKSGVETYYSTFGESELKVLSSLLFRSMLGFKYAIENSLVFGPERYLVVRFEDLVAAPAPTMQKVAQFIGIEFDDGLLRPTVLGRESRGNSFENRPMTAISNANAGRWRERITPSEAAVIDFHFSGVMEKFGYMPASSREAQLAATSEYYKWANYEYYFHDPFVPPAIAP